VEKANRLEKKLKKLRDEVQAVDADLRQMHCFIIGELSQITEILGYIEKLLEEIRSR